MTILRELFRVRGDAAIGLGLAILFAGGLVVTFIADHWPFKSRGR